MLLDGQPSVLSQLLSVLRLRMDTPTSQVPCRKPAKKRPWCLDLQSGERRVEIVHVVKKHGGGGGDCSWHRKQNYRVIPRLIPVSGLSVLFAFPSVAALSPLVHVSARSL